MQGNIQLEIINAKCLAQCVEPSAVIIIIIIITIIMVKSTNFVGRRPKQIFLQRRHIDGQEAHEKMLNMANYYRNANQNYNEVSSHTSQNGYHLKSLQITNAGEGVETREPSCWWECKLVQPLWKTVRRFLKELKIELPYDPAIPFLGIYPEKTIIQKDTCTPMFITALFTIGKTWTQPKYPLTDEQIKKMWYIYTVEYSAIKKNEIMPCAAATWMDPEIIILNEVSQKEKDKYHMISLTCGI